MTGWEWVGPLVMVANFVLSVAAIAVGWWRGQSKEVEVRLARVDDRLNVLERVTHEAPSRSEFHGIQLAIAEQSGSLRVISAQMAGQLEILKRVEAVVGRHEDHLLEKGGK